MSHLVSVIIPCYNGRAYVREAIDGALAQEGAEIEVIVVDDGSTDGTREIVEGYGDQIRRICQTNGGAGSARNGGISAAQGDYIAFLDCDDIWLPGKIRQQLAYFEERPNVGLVFTDSEFFNEKGILVPSNKLVRPPAEGQVLKALFQDNFITTSSVMVRRDCFKKVGVFRKDYRNAQDYDLWLRIAREYEFGYVNKVLVRYRVRGDGLTLHFENRYLTDIRILTEWIEEFPELFPKDDPRVKRRLGHLFFKLGRYSLHAGERNKARGYLLQSLRTNPKHLRAWVLLIVGLLPHSVTQGLRLFLQRIRGWRAGLKSLSVAVLIWGLLGMGLAWANSAWADEMTYQCAKIEPGPPIQIPDASDFSEADRDRGLVIFRQGNLDLLFAHTIPTAGLSEPVKLSAAPAEFEPVTFGLYPLREIKKVRIGIKDLVGENGTRIPAKYAHIRIARVLTLPTRELIIQRKSEECRPLPFVLMPEADLALRAGETRWIWLTVAVPEGALPGEYRSQIEIVPDGGNGLSIPLRLMVYPFRLDTSPTQYLMLYESSLMKLSEVLGAAERREILQKTEILYRDMKEHGMTALSFVETPLYELGPDGRPHFPATRVALDLARRVGLNGMPVIYIGPLARTEKKKYAWNYSEYDSAVHPGRVTRWVETVTAWARSEGWNAIAFAPIDEPGEPERSRIASEVLQAVKRVKGASTSVAVTPRSVAPLVGWVDVVNLNAERYTMNDHKKLQKLGKTIWIYDNSLAFGDPLKSRFVAGFYAWMADLDGVTAWTYPLAKFRPVDRITGWSPPELGPDGRPVPTVVWEALREGVDDRRYIETLERQIEKARKEGRSSAASEAEQALKEIVDRLRKAYTWYADVEKRGPYLGGLKMEALDGARERIARAIIRLSYR